MINLSFFLLQKKVFGGRLDNSNDKLDNEIYILDTGKREKYF
jgi:hypothetical protein